MKLTDCKKNGMESLSLGISSWNVIVASFGVWENPNLNLSYLAFPLLEGVGDVFEKCLKPRYAEHIMLAPLFSLSPWPPRPLQFISVSWS